MICQFATYWDSLLIMCSLSAWTGATGCLVLPWSILRAAEEWLILMWQDVASLPCVCPVSSPPSLYSHHLLSMWRHASTLVSSVQKLWTHWVACQSSDRHSWHQVMVWCHAVLNSASKKLSDCWEFMQYVTIIITYRIWHSILFVPAWHVGLRELCLQ